MVMSIFGHPAMNMDCLLNLSLILLLISAAYTQPNLDARGRQKRGLNTGVYTPS